MKRLFILVFSLAAVSALPYTRDLQRIVGGELTNISQYPFGTALLFGQGTFFNQACGGSIINYRTILSAAHCFNANYTPFWRARVGSANAHSGGVVHEIKLIINHPAYNRANLDNDISLLRITAAFAFNNNVNVGSIAGPNYNVPDNAAVWAIGWGRISVGGPQSEQLRHVQVWVVNLAICRSHYAEIGHDVTDSMLCSGWLDVGGRDQCQGDSGGPLLHNNVIVGVSSWGEGCAHPRFPGVNARVSPHTSWIQNNA